MAKNSHGDLHTYITDLSSFKVLLKEYQKIQDNEIINLSDHNQKVDSLKLDLLELRHNLSTKATLTQVLNLEEEIKKRNEDAHSVIAEFKKRFMVDINEKVENNLKSLSKWSNEHEEMVKDRLQQLQSIISMCAKESEMNALDESFKVNLHQLTKRVKSAESSLVETNHVIIDMKKNESCVLLHRCYVTFKKCLTKLAWKRWRTFWQKETNRIAAKKVNAKIMKKILIRCMTLVKRRVYIIWGEYILHDQQLQLRKEKATKVLRRWTEKTGIKYVDGAFKKWRWLITMDKINLPPPLFDSSNKKEVCKESSPTEQQKRMSRNKRTSYDPEAIVKSFGNDMKHIQVFLAQELNKIRNHDIVENYEDLDEKIKDVKSDSITENIKLVNRIESVLKQMETRTDNNYDYFENEIIQTRNILSKQENSLNNTAHRVKTFEEYHGKRIDTLFEQNQRIEGRLLKLERLLTCTDDKILNITKSQNINVNIVEDLTETQNKLSREINIMQEKCSTSIRNTHETFTATTQDLKLNEQNLVQTLFTSINDIKNFKASTKTSLGRINTILSTPGVRKPQLDTMINLCLRHEKIAHEKKYVVAMNYSCPYYKKDENNEVGDDGGHEMKIMMDIPEDIACFSYEYATWIAYQADHEVLMRIVDGSNNNGEDILFADDDTTKKRKSLLDCLKDEMNIELDEIHPEPGALRLKARKMYLARLIDATDSALSKHDQVLVSAHTRLGRIKPNTPVCVACDRPLRGKSRKGKICDIPIKQKDGHEGVMNTRMKIGTGACGGQDGELDLYVKKCGFKMPIKTKTYTDNKSE